MKRTSYISVLALAAALTFVACEEEEFVYVPEEPQIEILESDIIFDAIGGTGSVTVNAKGNMTASCTSDWCSASVSGNTLNVTATTNYGLDGRAATIILTCNGQDTKVTAQQTGMVFSYVDSEYIVEMNGGQFVINGKSSLPVTYQADEWISVDEMLGSFIVTVKGNDSGNKRTGTITISAGDVSAVYTVIQKFERNFSGTYEMSRFTSSSETTLEKTTVTIRQDADDPDLYYVEGWKGLTFPLHYDVAKDQLYMENALYMGQHTDGNWLYACKNFVNSTGSSYLSYNTTEPYYTLFDYKYENGKYSILFNDVPPTSSYSASTGFTIYTFSVSPDSGTAIASGNRVASVYVVRKPNFVQQ